MNAVNNIVACTLFVSLLIYCEEQLASDTFFTDYATLDRKIQFSFGEKNPCVFNVKDAMTYRMSSNNLMVEHLLIKHNNVSKTYPTRVYTQSNIPKLSSFYFSPSLNSFFVYFHPEHNNTNTVTFPISFEYEYYGINKLITQGNSTLNHFSLKILNENFNFKDSYVTDLEFIYRFDSERSKASFLKSLKNYPQGTPLKPSIDGLNVTFSFHTEIRGQDIFLINFTHDFLFPVCNITLLDIIKDHLFFIFISLALLIYCLVNSGEKQTKYEYHNL